MGKKINSNSGFSLIELLVGLAISCIVIVAAYSFVLTGIDSYDRTRKNTELQQETQFIENIIVDAVENGSEDGSTITEPATNIVQFDTGYQILYYDGSNNILALYDMSGDSPGDNIDEHIVSKNVTSFKVVYINDELTTDSSGDYQEEAETGKKTKLVKVDVEVEMNGKTDRTAKQYRFRND